MFINGLSASRFNAHGVLCWRASFGPTLAAETLLALVLHCDHDLIGLVDEVQCAHEHRVGSVGNGKHCN